VSVSSARRDRRWVGVWLVALLIVGVAAANGVYHQRVVPHFDFVAFWSAGRAVARGRSPYDAKVMADLQAPAGYSGDFYSPFYYPLWTGLFFVPLGLLSLRWAAAAWLTLNQVMLLAALGLVALGTRWRLGPLALGLLTVTSLVFHPTLVAFLDGQLSILMLFLLSATYYLLEVDAGNAVRLAPGGLLALTAVKPQLAFVTVPVLLAYLAFRRRWRGVAGFVVVFVTMAAASWLVAPGWVGDWLGERRQQMAVSRIVPSVWGLAHDVSPDFGPTLAGIVCAALLIWLGVLWWRERHADHLALLLALTVVVGQLVAPFLWVYDQTLLLFPFLVGMAHVARRQGRVAWWSALCLWAVVLPYILYALANFRNRATANALLPLILLGILTGSSWHARCRSGRTQLKAEPE